MRPRAYILCTTPRSGSTLLCRMLCETGVAGYPGSHFHEPSLEFWCAYHGLSRDAFASDREAAAAVIKVAMARGIEETELYGFRLQRHSADFFMRQLDDLTPGLPSDRARIEAAFGPTVFIHLIRRDKVGQAISYVRATQTGLWHQAPDGTEIERLSPPAEPVYDRDAIAARLAEATALDAAWDAWFAREQLSPLVLTYEALSADPVGTLSRVLDAIGRDPRAADDVAPATARLADSVSADWAARFMAETGGLTSPV